MNTENEEVGARWSVGSGKGCIKSPTKVGRTAFHEERRSQKSKGKRQNPETEIIQPRQRHVRRPNHHWDLPVGQADKPGHHNTKYHDQTMHGHHLIVEKRLKILEARLEKLHSNKHRHRATNKKQHETEP